MASTEFSPYDSADYLTSLEDVALYLEAALEEEAGDDPAFIAQVLGTIARSQKRQRARPQGRHEPRGSLQGALGRRQPQLRNRSESR